MAADTQENGSTPTFPQAQSSKAFVMPLCTRALLLKSFAQRSKTSAACEEENAAFLQVSKLSTEFGISKKERKEQPRMQIIMYWRVVVNLMLRKTKSDS